VYSIFETLCLIAIVWIDLNATLDSAGRNNKQHITQHTTTHNTPDPRFRFRFRASTPNPQPPSPSPPRRRYSLFLIPQCTVQSACTVYTTNVYVRAISNMQSAQSAIKLAIKHKDTPCKCSFPIKMYTPGNSNSRAGIANCKLQTETSQSQSPESPGRREVGVSVRASHVRNCVIP
jgi:hypothetical protein